MIKEKIKKVISVLSESKYVFFYNVFDRLFFFVFFVMIARKYEISQYGELITVFTLGSVMATIFDLGISYHLQREISRDTSNKNKYFNTAFILNVLLFVPYIIISFLLYKLLYNDLFSVFLAIIVINFVISQTNICNKALSGIKSFKSQFLASFIPKIIFLIALIILVNNFNLSILKLLEILLAALTINLFLSVSYCKKEGLKILWKTLELKEYKKYLLLSFPLGAAIIINLLYDRIDLLLVSKLTNFTESGIYNAGYSIFKASALGFSFILNKGFTEFSEIKNNRVLFRHFILKYSKIILVICIILNLILFLLPDILVMFFYSTKFESSGFILKILSFSLIGMGLNNLFGTALNGNGNYKTVMYITLSALLINILLNLIYIPIYGIKAAAIITVITEWLIFAGEFTYLIYFFRTDHKNAYI